MIYKDLKIYDIERFWSKVKKSDGCWEWQGGFTPKGYGWIGMHRKYINNGKLKCFYAHRLSYHLTFGDIPDGMCVCHKCDNPKCVRPSHLFLGTRLDNKKDQLKKRRFVTGSWNAKLTPEKVREIRALRPTTTLKALAERFNVRTATIMGICTGRTWKYV